MRRNTDTNIDTHQIERSGYGNMKKICATQDWSTSKSMPIIAGKPWELYKAKEKARFRGKMALVIP